MKFEEFEIEIEKELKEIDINLNKIQIKKFYQYMEMIIEWNKKLNLTSIIEPKDIIEKHFIDSLTIGKFIKENNKVIDVGTGAGFPGIPLSIYKENIEITLLDSLNKKIKFLDEVVKEIDLKKTNTIHGRVEDIARDDYREFFDVAVSRAVAPLNVLLEYLLPLVKVGGKCICMKGPNLKKELIGIENVLNELGGEIDEIDNVVLNGEIERNIVVIYKAEETKDTYPRKAGIARKNPIN